MTRDLIRPVVRHRKLVLNTFHKWKQAIDDKTIHRILAKSPSPVVVERSFTPTFKAATPPKLDSGYSSLNTTPSKAPFAKLKFLEPLEGERGYDDVVECDTDVSEEADASEISTIILKGKKRSVTSPASSYTSYSTQFRTEMDDPPQITINTSQSDISENTDNSKSFSFADQRTRLAGSKTAKLSQAERLRLIARSRRTKTPERSLKQARRDDDLDGVGNPQVMNKSKKTRNTYDQDDSGLILFDPDITDKDLFRIEER
jgi:hypothetical protein